MGPSRFDRPQLIFAGISALAAFAAAVLVFTDPRVLLGAPLWMKPFKFFISAALLSATLAYLIPRIKKSRRLVQLASWVIIVSLSVELVLITWAAARETTSHFNVSSPLAISIWAAMAGFITAVWVATMLLTLVYVRSGEGDAKIKRAFSWGLFISLVGMGVAFLMTGPTSDQLADFQGIAGAHTVGARDGGPGIPLFGWSTVAGDLRIPHFVGLHALQVLPAAVWMLRSRVTKRGIDFLALGYLSLLVLLTFQALIGQSIVQTSLEFAVGMLLAIALPLTGALIQYSLANGKTKAPSA